jgi:hypothetical protein
MNAPHLFPVPDDGPFLYPIDRSERLDGQTFVKWWHHRWLASEMRLMASFEVKGMVRDLFDLAQTQSPMGTLPRSLSVVARMLLVDERHFEGLCRHAYGPMNGWVPCITTDDELRLYHPVVLEQVQDALERRASWLASKSAAAVRERQRRLLAALRELKVPAAWLTDEALIERMDAWLVEHWRTKRTAEAYHRVIAKAKEEGWFGKPRTFENKA